MIGGGPEGTGAAAAAADEGTIEISGMALADTGAGKLEETKPGVERYPGAGTKPDDGTGADEPGEYFERRDGS